MLLQKNTQAFRGIDTAYILQFTVFSRGDYYYTEQYEIFQGHLYCLYRAIHPIFEGWIMHNAYINQHSTFEGWILVNKDAVFSCYGY